jgi:hypothetical protein
MPDAPSSPGLRLLWVPIVAALIAAAVVTVRGCQTAPAPSAHTTDRP